MNDSRYPQLAITALTNTPVIRISKSKKINVEYEFQQALMAWICEGELPGAGKTCTRQLKLDGWVHFEISLKQFVDYENDEPVTITPQEVTSP